MKNFLLRVVLFHLALAITVGVICALIGLQMTLTARIGYFWAWVAVVSPIVIIFAYLDCMTDEGPETEEEKEKPDPAEKAEALPLTPKQLAALEALKILNKNCDAALPYLKEHTKHLLTTNHPQAHVMANLVASMEWEYRE